MERTKTLRQIGEQVRRIIDKAYSGVDEDDAHTDATVERALKILGNYAANFAAHVPVNERGETDGSTPLPASIYAKQTEV